MSCPSWEDCNKKFCIENYRCCDPEYWASLSAFIVKRNKKVEARKRAEALLCSKVEGTCDKDATCKFLGQCIFTISAVKGNKKLIKALSGRKQMKEVLDILKELNPKPMRSYYLHSKKKK